MVARNTTTDTPTSELPEILRSAHLAAILTPILWEMTAEAVERFESQGLGRYMREPLAALRAMVNEIRKVHDLAAIDPLTGEPTGASVNGQAAEPEPATAGG